FVLSDLPAAPRIGFPEAKARPAILSPRGVEATSAGQRARWRGNACCDDSGKAPLFPSSQSSGSHVNGTTRYVVRQSVFFIRRDLSHVYQAYRRRIPVLVLGGPPFIRAVAA